MSYISITGLKPKGLIGFFRFWRFAIPSFEQTKNAKGIQAITRKERITNSKAPQIICFCFNRLFTTRQSTIFIFPV